MKNPLRAKEAYIGLLAVAGILALSVLETPLISGAVKWASRAIVDVVCPSGGLACLGWGIPLLVGYLTAGFLTGYMVSVVRTRT